MVGVTHAKHPVDCYSFYKIFWWPLTSGLGTGAEPSYIGLDGYKLHFSRPARKELTDYFLQEFSVLLVLFFAFSFVYFSVCCLLFSSFFLFSGFVFLVYSSRTLSSFTFLISFLEFTYNEHIIKVPLVWPSIFIFYYLWSSYTCGWNAKLVKISWNLKFPRFNPKFGVKCIVQHPSPKYHITALVFSSPFYDSFTKP